MHDALRALTLVLCLGLTGCTEWVTSFISPELRRAAPEPVLAWMGCSVADAGGSFEEVFGHGQACGALLGEVAWALDVSALDPAWRRSWYDGVGHGMREAPQDLEAWARTVEALPEDLRFIAHESALRTWTVEAEGDPAQVLPQVQAYGARVGLRELRNGVRTGLQESQGADMAAAIALALRYPEDWQPALLEELGWRVGDRQLRGGALLSTYAEAVPMPARCAFVQGAARGLSMRLLSPDHLRSGEGGAWSDVVALVASADPDCQSAGWSGVGWAAVISVGRDPAQARRALAGLPHEAGRREALATAAWASSGGREPWTRPSVQGLRGPPPGR